MDDVTRPPAWNLRSLQLNYKWVGDGYGYKWIVTLYGESPSTCVPLAYPVACSVRMLMYITGSFRSRGRFCTFHLLPTWINSETASSGSNEDFFFLPPSRPRPSRVMPLLIAICLKFQRAAYEEACPVWANSETYMSVNT